MSLLLLLYGIGEEGGTPTPTPTPTEEEIILGGMYLPASKRKRKRDSSREAYRNYVNRLLRDDDELIILMALMDSQD